MNTPEIIISILAALGIIFFFFVMRAIDNAPLYDTCSRCGWDLPAESVHDTFCDGCRNLTDDEAYDLYINTL